MIKYWDGYKYVYSPAKISYGKPAHFDKIQEVTAMNEETGNNLPVKKLIHHAKQNGYSNVWYDAVNGVHPKCRDLRELENQSMVSIRSLKIQDCWSDSLRESTVDTCNQLFVHSGRVTSPD